MKDLEVRIFIEANCPFTNKVLYKYNYYTILQYPEEDVNLDLIGTSMSSLIYNPNLKRWTRIDRVLCTYLDLEAEPINLLKK